MEERAKRLADAVDMYINTNTPVEQILRATHIGSRDLYDELHVIDAPLRGTDNWTHRIRITEDEAKNIVRLMVEEGLSVYALTRRLEMDRSTIQRGALFYIVEVLKRGEDVREWLS